jgi:hypothetical protein
MARWHWIAAALGLAVPSALAAQPITITRQDIAEMCSPETALQYRFGQTGIAFAREFRIMLDPPIEISPPIAGFSLITPRSTSWTDQLFGIDYFQSAIDKEELWLLALEMDVTLDELGWRRVERDYEYSEEEEIDLAVYNWTRPIVVDGIETELRLDLSNSIGMTTLSCDRADLMELQVREYLGELPPGTPRPVEPQLPGALPPTIVACGRPEFAPQVEAFLAGQDAGPYITSVLMMGDYHKRLTDWKKWKLTQSGKIDESRMQDILLDAFFDGGGDASPLAALEKLMEMFPIFNELKTAQDSGDRQAICAGFVKFNGFFAELERTTAAQWGALDKVLDREAARLGVSLD